jgi:hypothetical protein
MTLNFRARARTTSDCTHESEMRIEVAGMSRDVCEACGRVSLGYVEDHYAEWRESETEESDPSDGPGPEDV